MKKPQLAIRTTLLIIISILNFMIAVLVGNVVYQSWGNLREARSLTQSSEIINALYNVNRSLSMERAASLSVMFAAPETAQDLYNGLTQDRLQADTALDSVFFRLEKQPSPDLSDSSAKIEEKYQALRELRQALDDAMKLPSASRDYTIADKFSVASTDLISEVQNFILSYSEIHQSIDAIASRQMMFKYFVWELAEYTGEEYAMIGRAIAEDKPLPRDYQEKLGTLRERTRHGWDILHKFTFNEEMATRLLPFMEEAQTHYFMTFDQVRDFFYTDELSSEGSTYPISIEMWLGMASQAVSSLLTLQDEVLKESQKHVAWMEEKAKREGALSALVLLCALALSFYSWKIIVFRVTRPINAMVNALYKATRDEAYEMPKILYQHDEIGKLARVLEVFQDNAHKMKQSNEELERFAYIAAHDLKSPLRAVDNISQWLEEDLGDSLPAKDKKYLEELRSRVTLMDRLLDDTLEYARVGTKMNEDVANNIVSAKELVEGLGALLVFPSGFTFKIGENLSSIKLRRFPIQQVLYNLINNALKHHDKENGTIEVECEEKDAEFIFIVRDDGPGIDPQFHQKIFEMFQTLYTRDKSLGRGMGLAVVRKIITTNGGKIEVRSKLGQGAEFRFTWPRYEKQFRSGS